MRTPATTRSATSAYVYSEPGACGGTAIYTLSDPRDARCARYVGQTRDPHARYLQHLKLARLAVPDKVPWWVRSAKHRPLYEWIRELHRDGGRLPFMWVEQWVEAGADVLVAERAAIMRRLAQGAPLLNAEALRLGAQLPLL